MSHVRFRVLHIGMNQNPHRTNTAPIRQLQIVKNPLFKLSKLLLKVILTERRRSHRLITFLIPNLNQSTGFPKRIGLQRFPCKISNPLISRSMMSKSSTS